MVSIKNSEETCAPSVATLQSYNKIFKQPNYDPSNFTNAESSQRHGSDSECFLRKVCDFFRNFAVPFTKSGE